jgi:hypothetical protein
MNNTKYICNLAVSGVHYENAIWKCANQRRTIANNDSTLLKTKSTRRSNGVSWNLPYKNHMIWPGMSRRALLRSMFERVSRSKRTESHQHLSAEYCSIEGQEN